MKKLIIVILALSLFSCGNGNLTNSEAKSILLLKYNFPTTETMRLTVLDKTTSLNSTINQLNKFQQRGLLNYQIEKPRRISGFARVSVGGNSKTVTAKLTDKGRKYIMSEKKGGLSSSLLYS